MLRDRLTGRDPVPRFRCRVRAGRRPRHRGHGDRRHRCHLSSGRCAHVGRRPRVRHSRRVWMGLERGDRLSPPHDADPADHLSRHRSSIWVMLATLAFALMHRGHERLGGSTLALAMLGKVWPMILVRRSSSSREGNRRSGPSRSLDSSESLYGSSSVERTRPARF